MDNIYPGKIFVDATPPVYIPMSEEYIKVALEVVRANNAIVAANLEILRLLSNPMMVVNG